MITSLHCIATRNPRRDKINSHIPSIISEKKRPIKPSDKVATKLKQVRTEDTKLKRTNEKKSKPDPRPVHTKNRRKKTKTHSPTATKQTIIVLHIYNRVLSYQP